MTPLGNIQSPFCTLCISNITSAPVVAPNCTLLTNPLRILPITTLCKEYNKYVPSNHTGRQYPTGNPASSQVANPKPATASET